ncbi:DCC1-like thiol-disulfide oxidoreductase family protein [Haloferula chungangensis]|uniref:DCC1-like thiol-disulfide oxidoreductase family protein n=1 Tax=Haloferula chungangensis TaxID=1048331 RepID=A0ABW2LA23_9BACT
MKTFDQIKPMSAWQFAIFRIVFGVYLLIHFLMLMPYSGELFGARGVIGDASLNPTSGLFPTPFACELPDAVCALLIGVLVVAAGRFAGGVWRGWMAVVLWFGWSALFHRNNLIANPSIPYVGLLLMLCVLIPNGEPLSFGRKDKGWAMPLWTWRCAWILLAVGYTFSGWTKLSSPSWIDGSAMRYLLENPLARDGWMREVMLALPDGVLMALTWMTLLSELLFLPLAMWSKSRPWIWLMLVGMHLGIVAVVDFADLSLGMLMIHAFTFDPDWLPGRRKGEVLLAYDGDCLMCSGFIRFLAHEDRNCVLRFTTLQGVRGRALEKRAGSERLSSLVLEVDGRVLVKSTAVLELGVMLGGMWRGIAMVGRLVPETWRDQLYDAVAYRRKTVKNSCGLPSLEVRDRMID